MGTFISSLIIYGFAAAVLGLVGKLIYDIQQTKKETKEVDELCKTEAEFELKDKFQTLAGIKGEQTHSLSVDELKKEFQNTEFPAPDPSIPVITAKLTTIGGNYGDSDPLASVPMSRVSKKAKQKMAEIAKQDISEQLEQNAEKFSTLIESDKPKTKKRNPKQDIKGMDDGNPFVKTRKKTNKNKQ